jgi:hypothetical protein
LKVRQEFRERIVQRRLAIVDQFQQARRRELLGHRSDAEHVIRRQGRVQFDARSTARAAIQHCVATRHQHRNPGTAFVDPLGELRFDVARHRRLVGHARFGVRE